MTFTVVVIGFYGSSERYVEKYARTWRENVPGVEKTITNACSGTFSFITLGTFKDARALAKQVEGSKNVVFHVLSNRGMLVYLEAVRLLPKYVKVAGVVFDSCPGALSPWLFFKATAANQKDIKIWTRLYHLWVARLDPAACPALFLYSSRDELVGSTLVERCAADREQAIGRVFRKKWEDSPHVEHLRVHEEEYVEELRSFSAKLEVI